MNTIILMLVNWLLIIATLYIAYRIIRKMFKTWMIEALREFEKNEATRKVMHRVQETRDKYR